MAINAQGSKPRDTQRSRLYDAEDSIRSRRVSTAAKRHLTDTQNVAGRMVYDVSRPPRLVAVTHPGGVVKMEPRHELVPAKCPTTEAVQSYMDAVTEAAWYQRRWSQKFRYVNGRGSHGAGGRVTVSQEHRWSEAVILHEMAHTLTPSQYAWHGPEFAGVLLTLVKHVMGAKHADDLRAAFKVHRVRHNMKAVPAPTRTVTPQSERVKRVRAAAKREVAEREAALRRSSSRRHAAAVIRLAVADGLYGEPRSKQRNAALATARALESAPGVLTRAAKG